MEYKVILAPGLDQMLLKHTRFIAQVSIPAAKRFRNEFEQIIERLSENPYQFPTVDDPSLPYNTYRKALFARWYQAIFYVDGKTVFLDAVLDGRMDTGGKGN